MKKIIICFSTFIGILIFLFLLFFMMMLTPVKEFKNKSNFLNSSISIFVNSSITYTFTRNVNTTLTTLIMLVCLLIFGVASVKEFAAPLIVGILAGAYSSICITSALWYIMGGKKRGIVNEQPVKAKTYEDGAQV